MTSSLPVTYRQRDNVSLCVLHLPEFHRPLSHCSHPLPEDSVGMEKLKATLSKDEVSFLNSVYSVVNSEEAAVPPPPPPPPVPLPPTPQRYRVHDQLLYIASP